MHSITHKLKTAVVAAVVASAAGCAQLGPLGEVLGGVLTPAGGQGGQGGEVQGEVQGVDTQRRIIQIRTQNGQTGNVQYDERTRLIYQQQEHPVSGLERGDVVAMRIQQDSRGGMYTDMIQVLRNVREGTGGMSGGGAYQQLYGTVTSIDTNRYQMSLRTQDRGILVVTMSPNASRYEADRFRQLRTGQNVSMEGRFVSDTHFQLERFR